MIRPAHIDDAQAIVNIYNHYVEHSVVTFEEIVVDVDDMMSRIKKVTCSGLPWLVAEEAGAVVAYAYASAWHQRSAFRHSVEVTVYVSNSARAAGWGSRLYHELLTQLKNLPINVAIAAITVPNDASIALNEKFGFVKVGHFYRVGYKFGQWLDVGYWQYSFNLAAPDSDSIDV